jgi:hypothetical protein
MPGLNDFTVPAWVAMEPLRLLLNKLEIAGRMSTNWNDEFKRDFAVGEVITVKKPNRFKAVDGLELEEQPLSTPTTTINLNQPFHVAFAWDDFEKVINMEKPDENVRRLYIEPAAEEMYQQIESRAALFAYQNTPNVFGVLGTNPTDNSSFLDARDRLHDKAGLKGIPGAFVSSRMMTSFLRNQSVQMNPAADISKQYRKGIVDEVAGLEWFRTASLYRHTAGTWAGAVTVNGAGQSGSTLNVTCTTGDTFKQGDSFSILNVNFVNPQTRRVPSGNQVQHFVVQADVTGVASAAALPIYPPIAGPGDVFQNVDALPAAGAALTLWPGTSSPNGKAGTQGLVLGDDAFAIVGAKYERPPNVVCSYAQDPNTKLSIRFTRQWDIKTTKTYSRWDMAVGFGVLYADEAAARVVGA